MHAHIVVWAQSNRDEARARDIARDVVAGRTPAQVREFWDECMSEEETSLQMIGPGHEVAYLPSGCPRARSEYRCPRRADHQVAPLNRSSAARGAVKAALPLFWLTCAREYGRVIEQGMRPVAAGDRRDSDRCDRGAV